MFLNCWFMYYIVNLTLKVFTFISFYCLCKCTWTKMVGNKRIDCCSTNHLTNRQLNLINLKVGNNGRKQCN